MIAEVVLDTNVLVYAASGTAGEAWKRDLAMNLLQAKEVGLSGQILQEFYVTVTRKARQPLSHDDALDWIEAFEDYPIVPIDAAIVRNGAELARRYQLSYWDGAVLAAAHALQAHTLYSEDFNDNQLYGSVRVENPFRNH